MKRFFFAMASMLIMATTMSAQRIVDVRGEAQYITDKMALELGLTDSQKGSILQLNITYLDGINGYRDIESTGWKYRNKHIKALLSAKQWKLYKKARWFYRPIGWKDNAYVHRIYAKYPRHYGHKPGNGPHRQPQFGSKRGHLGNNSPEAIKMRKEMKKETKHGAR